MTVSEAISYDALDAAVVRLHLGVTAGELHGSLCGFLVGGGRIGAGAVLAALQLDGEAAALTPADRAWFDPLVTQSQLALADPELGFELLQPDDSRPLPERAQALVDWCRGFLGGFGLSRVKTFRPLSDDEEEIVRDLNNIAASDLDFGDESEDEDAFIEIYEFVRTGVMLLFVERAEQHSQAGGAPH